MNRSTDLRLITIPISHYCEKARWALERADLPYVELRHLQLLHWLATVPRGGRSVPVLLTPDVSLTDSTDILRWIDGRIPEERRICDGDEAEASLEWEERFDSGLGPDGRAWMYHVMLPRKDLLLAYGAPGVPRWERLSLPLTLPVVSMVIRRAFRLDDARATRCLDRCRAELDAVAEQLSDGRPYLLGERFTCADLTFACLVAPLVLPEKYGVPMPRLDELDAPVRAVIQECREHPAGVFALRLYDERRLADGGP